MRKLFLSLGMAALAIPAAGVIIAPAAIAQSRSDLAAVAAHIEAAKTMTASFIQSDRSGRSQRGTLQMKRPGKVRFEYGTGSDLLIVADGNSLNMIDYQVRQVQRWPIKNSPLSALLDPARDLSKYGQLVPTGDSNVVSISVKDPKRPEYGTITMIFLKDKSAPAGLALHSWVALDSQNNRTTVKLSNVRYNVAVADSAFKWKDPRGRTGPKGR